MKPELPARDISGMLIPCLDAQAPTNRAILTKLRQEWSRYRPANRLQNSMKRRKIPLLSRLENWAVAKGERFGRSGSQRLAGKRSPRKQRKLDGAPINRRLFSLVKRISLQGQMTELEEFKALVNGVADKADSDFLLFSNSIYDAQTDHFIKAVCDIKKKRSNVSLILCTNGGSADAGYRIARCLKKNYKKFLLYVFGNCKSAGTLIAVGANEIVMSHFGQFGPLDVQLADKDEFLGQTPALDVSQSITTLSESAYTCFMDQFLKLEPGRSISTKTAVEIGKSLTLGIIGPIASQIDPLLLGRVDRSMRIAEAYIKRLNSSFKDANAKKLIGGYPSHDFVIDFDEAKEVFGNVREPTEEEMKVESYLRNWDKLPKQNNWVGVISDEKKEPIDASIPVDSASGKADGQAKDGGEPARKTAAASMESSSRSAGQEPVSRNN
jgi:hypothetical protein